MALKSSVPPFLLKLWRLVDGASTNDLICWSRSGRSFIITDELKFAETLLPLFFKHNNMTTFIRQLNMYGFHKLKSNNKNRLGKIVDDTEFHHPCFRQRYPYLLDSIKRKTTNSNSNSTTNSPSNSPSKDSRREQTQPKIDYLFSEQIKKLRAGQDEMESRIGMLKRENEILLKEIQFLTKENNKQQNVVNRIIDFLREAIQPTRKSYKKNFASTKAKPKGFQEQARDMVAELIKEKFKGNKNSLAASTLGLESPKTMATIQYHSPDGSEVVYDIMEEQHNQRTTTPMLTEKSKTDSKKIASNPSDEAISEDQDLIEQYLVTT